ncbi:predicted protein [Pyrenophora tritici-repentis Pt-1C-BFP]|uniref:Uncharacterized protein n=1 Tax=Pyrenophora tritici-repentis (strain Pt-1C-BFP) TaxID=426418 RepID=B2VZX4_PYRTR|nr:uncharacterized protein PTRG_02964 [Pyrenophora tritici-repentis Pt-1C-BFP]EDU45487.1 predicted protein [Pyrenophora tritici-repentis Pt-1C-BFP]
MQAAPKQVQTTDMPYEAKTTGGLAASGGHHQSVSRLIGPPQYILSGPVGKEVGLGTDSMARCVHQDERRPGSVGRVWLKRNAYSSGRVLSKEATISARAWWYGDV